MTTEAKRIPMPPEVRRIYTLGQAFQSLPKDGAVWAALEEALKHGFEETRLSASDPETKADKREFWCGAHHQASEFRDYLRELQSGAWQQWPVVAEWRRANGGGDGEE